MRERPAIVRPNRVALAACAAFGCSIGLLPYLLFVNRPVYLALYFPLALLLGLLSLRGFRTQATEAPEVGEFVLATWNASLYGAGGSIAALSFHLMAHGFWQLVRAIAAWLGSAVGTSAGAAAYWVSLTIAVICGFSSSFVAAPEMGRKLYPDTAGARSPYFDLILEERRLTRMLGFSLLAGLVLLVLIDRASVWFVPALLALVALSAASLENLGKSPLKTEKKEALEALVKLLNAVGYHTVLSPRTGLADVDPLLINVDLLARSPQATLVIEVKSAAGGEGPVEWQEASRLRTACWSLADALAGDGQSRMDPLMVLVQRPAAESLEHFARDEGVRLVRFESAEPIARARREHDPERLRQMAREHLGLEPTGPAVGGAQPAASAAS